MQRFVGLQYRALGDPKNAIATFESMVREADTPGHRANLISAPARIVETLVSMGDVSRAGTYAARMQQRIEEARGSVSPKWRTAYSIYGHYWEAEAELGARDGV